MSIPAPDDWSLDPARLVAGLGEYFQTILTKPWLPILVNVGALLLLASGLAQWTWLFFTPSVPQIIPDAGSRVQTAPAVANWQPLLAAQLFGAGPTTSGANIDRIPISSLNLALTGVVMAGKESFALIRVDKQPESPFAINQEITPGVVLQEVYSDRALILRAGVTESLLLEGSAAVPLPGMTPDNAAPAKDNTANPSNANTLPIRQQGQNQYLVPRSFIDDQMHNPQGFLNQALIVPYNNGGFLVREVRPGSIFEKLGLRAGDIIRGANGQALNSMEDVMKAYREANSNVVLDILRNGKQENLLYTINF